MKKRERLNRKALAMALVLVLIIGLIPAHVFANTDNTDNTDRSNSIAFTVGEAGYWMEGTWVASDATPYIQAGRIMVPVAHASRALGAAVTWQADTKEVEVAHNGDTYTLTIGSNQLLQNGEPLEEMDTVPVIQDLGNGLGRTMLPVSRLAKVLGVDYNWDAATKTATFMPMAEEGPVVYDQAGTYGPEEDVETIDIDVIISADGVTLQNMVITGNLTITEDVGDGDVTLNNITVEGDTIIKGGGTDSIHINGGSYNNIIVQRTPSGALRVVFSGPNPPQIEIDLEADEQILILEGNYDRVIVTAPNVRIITRGGTQINELIITSSASNTTLETSDDTTIEKALVDGEGTVFEGASGTVKEVEGNEKNNLEDKDDVVVKPPASTSGGGGGGSSQPSTPPSVPSAEFAGGNGSEANPYQVATAQQLNNVRNHLDKHFIQIADINLGQAPWNTDEGWEPIGEETPYVGPSSISVMVYDELAFQGTYDGQNYIISNMFIERPDQNHVGLFGYAEGASFKNIKIQGADVTGRMGVGALVGITFEGDISECTTSGLVMGHHHTVGGLTGYNYRSQINQSSTSGSVTSGYGTVGGLAGRMFSGSIIESFSTADVVNLDHYSAGGLVGSIDGVTDVVQDCYAAGDVYGVHENGGLAGRMITSSGMVINSYAIGSVTGTSGNGGLIGNLDSGDVQLSYHNGPDNTTGSLKTNDEMKEVDTYPDWDFPNIWTINTTDNGGYPALAWQGFNHTSEDTSEFAGGNGTEANPYIIETAEQLDAVRNHLDKHFELANNINLNGYNWVPIGDISSSAFYGTFDGKGYEIRNLSTSVNVRASGLFGYVVDAQIKNIRVVDAEVHPTINYEHQVGILVGYAARTTITKCSTSGSVRGGGVAGSVTGGLVGLIRDNTTVEQCYSTASVGGSVVGGGLVASTDSSTIIKNSYAAGSINTNSGGGLVQFIQGEVTNSYTITTMEGNDYLFAQGIAEATVDGCYYKNVEGKTAVGNDTDPAQPIQGLDDNQMMLMASYVGWDFTNIWGINSAENNGYPFLRWQGYSHNPPE